MTSRYILDCTDCSFQTTVVGTFPAVSEEVEAHQDAQSAGPTDHFVNVQRVDDSE